MHYARFVFIVGGVMLLLSGVVRSQFANHVVISELYAGGGNSGAQFKNDFVELYNPTASAVVMTNWSIQYASAASTSAFGARTIITGTIAPHAYFLIQEAQGAGGSISLPTPDAVGTLNFAASNGKIALVNDSLAVTHHGDATVVDFLGYGTANDAEGALPVQGLDNTHSAERKARFAATAASMATGGSDELSGNGYDTDLNANDCVSQSLPHPQNSASPAELPPPGNQPPLIGTIVRSPLIPPALSPDTITAVILDDGAIASAKVHVRVNGGEYDSSLAMSHSSGLTWVTVLPPSKSPADGALVEYFLSATDDSSVTTSTELSVAGYFAGDAPVSVIKSHSLAEVAGYLAQVSGFINVRTNSFANGEGYLQEATGGLEVFKTGGLPSLDPGRNARVRGSITDFNGACVLSSPVFLDTIGTSALVHARGVAAE